MGMKEVLSYTDQYNSIVQQGRVHRPASNILVENVQKYSQLEGTPNRIKQFYSSPTLSSVYLYSRTSISTYITGKKSGISLTFLTETSPSENPVKLHENHAPFNSSCPLSASLKTWSEHFHR